MLTINITKNPTWTLAINTVNHMTGSEPVPIYRSVHRKPIIRPMDELKKILPAVFRRVRLSELEKMQFNVLWRNVDLIVGIEPDDFDGFDEYELASLSTGPKFCKKEPEREGQSHNTLEMSCPEYLTIRHSSLSRTGYGVFAVQYLPKNIWFGPFEGEIKPDARDVSTLGFNWAVFEEVEESPQICHYIDASDTSKCNWMRYVNFGRYIIEQNLVALQYKGEVYYKTIKPIKADTELLIWYGDEYLCKTRLSEKIPFSRNTVKKDQKKPVVQCNVLDNQIFHQAVDPKWLLHNDPEQQNFYCCMCGRDFTQDEYVELQRAAALKHQGQSMPAYFMCTECSVIFSSQGKSQNSPVPKEIPPNEKITEIRPTKIIIEVVKEEEKTVKMDSPQPKSPNVVSVTRNSHINSQVNPPRSILDHYKSVCATSSTKAYSYICSICGKGFNMLANLKVHTMMHKSKTQTITNPESSYSRGNNSIEPVTILARLKDQAQPSRVNSSIEVDNLRQNGVFKSEVEPTAMNISVNSENVHNILGQVSYVIKQEAHNSVQNVAIKSADDLTRVSNSVYTANDLNVLAQINCVKKTESDTDEDEDENPMETDHSIDNELDGAYTSEVGDPMDIETDTTVPNQGIHSLQTEAHSSRINHTTFSHSMVQQAQSSQINHAILNETDSDQLHFPEIGRVFLNKTSASRLNPSVQTVQNETLGSTSNQLNFPEVSGPLQTDTTASQLLLNLSQQANHSSTSTYKDSDSTLQLSNISVVNTRINKDVDTVLKTLHSCGVCGKMFKNHDYLVMHAKTHHAHGVNIFECEICGRKFMEKAKLDQHMNSHDTDRPHTCTVCGQTYARQSYLAVHMRVHNGQRPYECIVCGKTFKQQSVLITHFKVHSEERPFSCDSCDKKFKSQSDLTRHLRTHTKQKPYTCNVCGAGFPRTDQLNRHMKIHNKSHEES